MGSNEEIGALFVKIGADVTGLKSGLAEGDKEVTSFTGRINSGLLKAAGILGGIGVGIGALVVTAFEHTEALGQSAFDMGEKFGMSGGEASKWLAIAGQLGISADSIGIGFKFLGKNMGDIQLALSNGQKPTKALTESFDELGVSLYDSKGHLRDTNDVMNQVANAFAKMADGPQKQAAAMKIFGRSGADLIPLLNQGAAGLATMSAEGVKLGTVLSTQQVEAAHKAYLAHKQFDEALSGLATRIGIDVMPAATTFFNVVVTKGVPALEGFGKKLQSFQPYLWTAFDIFKALGPYLVIVGGAWAAWNVAIAITNALMAAQRFASLIGLVITFTSQVGLAKTAMLLFDLAMDANPIGLVIAGIALLTAGFVYAYTHSKPFHDFVDALWDSLQRLWAFIVNSLKPELQSLSEWFRNLGSGLSAIGGAAHAAHIPGFATGGIVPGPMGAPMLAVVHGGERVQTPAQQQQGGSGGGGNVTVTLTPARLNNPSDLLDALYALMSAAQTRRARGAQGFLGAVPGT